MIQLRPNRRLQDCPVAVTSGHVTEGLTIASNLERFVAGRLAQREVITHRAKQLRDSSEAFLAFAAHFGAVTTVEAVLAALSEIEQTEKPLRPGKTWQIADPDDPLCQVLASAWTLNRPALGEWAINAVQQWPAMDILWRLVVSHHVLSNTGEDITDAVCRLVRANDVFDSTYISRYRKPATGAWEIEALVLGIKKLQAAGKDAPSLPASLWDAAQAFAQAPHEKDEKRQYDGRPHLNAARELADSEPDVAYHQIANAAAFFGRKTGEVLPKAVIMAYELCAANQWTDLQALLAWTREELGL